MLRDFPINFLIRQVEILMNKAFLNDHFHFMDDDFGLFSLLPMNPTKSAVTIESWVNQEYALYWNMMGFNRERIQTFYEDMQSAPNKAAYIGLCDGEPAFLVELYDPAEDQLAECYTVLEGDIGMHLLVAPPTSPRSGFTLAVMRCVMKSIFSNSSAKRVVVEPDINNHKIHRLNCRVGFTHVQPVNLGDKTALLGFCTPQSFSNSLVYSPDHNARMQTAHLSPHYWEKANRLLLRKILSEFSHEQILQPEKLAPENRYRIQISDTLAYEFSARRLKVDHWLIDDRKIDRFHNRDGAGWVQGGEPDVLEFLIAIREKLDIRADDFPLYLEEISSTLFSSCYKLSTSGRTADALCHGDYQAVEAAMTEGHPIFVANNGRIGFGADDYHRYAPETAHPEQLVWLAAIRTKAVFSSVRELDYARLIESELDAIVVAQWRNHLMFLGLEPDDYYFMPVHPWQWTNKTAITFAAEVARRDLVYLGLGPDVYQSQQSIRTFFNLSAPHKHYVKTALSVLNMGFMRGLSPEYMRGTPAINQWLADLLEQDNFLQGNGFSILREIAAIGYTNPNYTKEITGATGYGKMLSALWREAPRLKTGERLMTMAALLHVDVHGEALVKKLIEVSGIGADVWITDYLQAYFVPLIHCLYVHDLVFMPHGENLIMVLEEGRITRMIMKDIGEEVGLLNSRLNVPDEVSRISYQVDEKLVANCIFTDVFDGFFRHLAAILVDQQVMQEKDFWALVASSIRNYQNTHPQNADKYQRYDLFQQTIVRNCFNRLQLRNNRHMLNLLDPEISFQYGDPIANPIACYDGLP